jgi:drug/metabolite transporter, DME family
METTNRSSQQTLGLVAIVLAVILFAVGANIIGSLLIAGVNPFELAVSSVTIGTFSLALVHSFIARSPATAMNRPQFGMGLLFAGLIGLNYWAIASLPVAVAILLLFTSPVMLVLWTAVTTRRLPSRSLLAAMLLLIAGVVLVSKVLESNLSEFNGFGILIGLLSAVFFTAYNLQSERVGASAETLEVMLKTFAVASLFWLAYQITQGVPLTLLEPTHVWKVLYVGIAGNLLPYALFFWGVQRIQAERAVVIATLEPVIAAGLAWVWFGQTLTLWQIIGGVAIVAAVTGLQLIHPPSVPATEIRDR